MSGRDDDINMEVIDARNSLGIVIITETTEGVSVDLKGIKLDKLTLAKLLYDLAKKLKAMHDAETGDRP